MATVALLGTLDTKGEEYAYMRARVEQAGSAVLMINAGVMADPDYRVDFTRADVAAAAGSDLGELTAADRGRAVAIQARGAAAIVRELFVADRVQGLLGMGGSGGSSIVSTAMRQLPIGVPKLLVSTMASGDTSPYVDISDVTMMYPVVDLAGINQLSARILANAAAAISGMARGYEAYHRSDSGRPLVGATMYGTTTTCVDAAREWLEEHGYEVLVFHATGPGGRSMEALMESGHITAALDVTTAELMGEIAGGTMTAGPDRLETAGKLGLPQVVAPGGTDQIAFRPPSAVPADFRERHSYEHNHAITLVRSNAEEMASFGRLIAGKLNRATGPVAVFVPLRGFSEYDAPGGVFCDPVADQALIEALRNHLDRKVERIEMDTHINDPEFAVAMARKLDELYHSWGPIPGDRARGDMVSRPKEVSDV
ncbi:MAG: Tm-1-like ATP-binding domain-containing protein [Acidimicrobiia bacterium]